MAPHTFLLTFAGATALAVGAVTAQQPAPDAERAALTRKLRAAETRLYATQLRLAWREWKHGALPEFLAALDECSPEMRHWEHAYLRRLCEDRVRVVDTGLREILAEAFSPDGKWLAAAGVDQTVGIWDARTGALHRRLKAHPGLVLRLAFSHDTRGTGRLCLAGASGTEIRIWDVATGDLLQTVVTAPGDGIVVGFSPDGRRLASAERSGRGAEQPSAITIWDRTLGKRAFALRGHHSGVLNLAFSPDGKRLASVGRPPLASGPGEVKVWELASHGLALELNGHDLKGHEAAPAGLAFSPDGRRLATACHDATIYLWDLASGKPARSKGHERAVTAVAFSADGRRLVSSAIDDTVRVWDLTGVKKPIILDGTQGAVLGTLRCVSFSLDGQRVAAWSGNGRLWGWGLTATQDTILLKGHRQKVTCLAFGARRARLLSGAGLVYNDKGEELWGELRMWDTPAGRESLAVGEHTAWITALAVSPDGKSFASGSSDRIVTFGEVASGHTKRIFRGHGSAVSALAFQPGGTLLAAAEADGPIRLWDTATRKPSLIPLKGQDGPVQCMAFSADGKRLACAAWSGVHVWDVATGVGSKTPLVGKAALHNTTFSPDGKWLAGGAVREKAARPGVVFIWDAATGREVMALEGHDGRVAAVAFSPDGRRLASAGVDGTVRIWDLGVGLEVYRLGGLPKTVRCLAFSPDGRYLACGAGETVRVWDSGAWRKGKG